MADTTPAGDRIGLGIASVLVGMFAVAGMDAAAKWLATGYPVAELVFFRSLFALPPILLLVWHGGGRAALRIRWGWGHLLRAVFALSAIFCFFTALRVMPLAEATSIAFAAPLFVTALSVPVLGEHVGPRRWAAVVVGFLGVLVMTRPGSAAFQPEALLVLGAALCYACAMLVTRRLARTETTPAITFYGTLLLLAGSAIPLPFGWRVPEAEDMVVFVLMGLFGGATMYFMTQAYRYAPAAVVAPFDYTALIWATLFGWLIWHELPDSYVWAGAAIVIASGLYIIRREMRVGQPRQ